MNARSFYGKRRDLVAVIPEDGDDSDDGLADDDDDDVNDPDFTANINEDDSDDAVSDLSNDDEQMPSGSTVEPCPKKRKVNTSQPKLVPIEKNGTSTSHVSDPTRERLWRKRDIDNSYPLEKDFTVPDELSTPFQYFSRYFTPELVDLLVQQTNLYSVQETTRSICTTVGEIQKFLAVLLYMGICPLPAMDDYWSVHFRYPLVADIMSSKRFKCLKRYLHFVDNHDKKDTQNDKFHKVRPVFEMVRRQCKKTEGSNHQSVDEVMVPYKGTRAGTLRQYVKNKPHKWGFKIYCRSSSSGIVHDLLLYQGTTTFCDEDLPENEKDFLLGEKVMLVLCRSIPDPSSCVVFCDNFFTSYKLVKKLESLIGIKCLGTVRESRCGGVQLLSDKDMKKQERGHYDYKSSEDVIAIKWHDNKCVTLLSNAVGVEPEGAVKRYDKHKKRKIDIPCPSIVLAYNKHMGGLDLSDMLVFLYKTPMKSHRWYLPIFGYLLDLSVANSWLLYKREATLLKESPMTLKCFRAEIAGTLVKINQKVSVGRPLSRGTTPKKGNVKKAKPSKDVRYDGIDHWPVPTSSEKQARGRCSLCPKGVSGFRCTKCNVFLCLKNKQMCFVQYHTQT